MNLDERAINVFTDGSSLPAPRRGGTRICIVTVDDDGREVIETMQPQGHQGATNQQMELLACVSLDSPHCGNVDDFSSEVMLSARHTYDIRLNDHPKNPRVEDSTARS